MAIRRYKVLTIVFTILIVFYSIFLWQTAKSPIMNKKNIASLQYRESERIHEDIEKQLENFRNKNIENNKKFDEDRKKRINEKREAENKSKREKNYDINDKHTSSRFDS